MDDASREVVSAAATTAPSIPSAALEVAASACALASR